jgi:hypothetical protein
MSYQPSTTAPLSALDAVELLCQDSSNIELVRNKINSLHDNDTLADEYAKQRSSRRRKEKSELYKNWEISRYSGEMDFKPVGKLYNNRLVLCDCLPDDMTGSSSFVMTDGELRPKKSCKESVESKEQLESYKQSYFKTVEDEKRCKYELYKTAMVSKLRDDYKQRSAALNVESESYEYDFVNYLGASLKEWENMTYDDYLKKYAEEEKEEKPKRKKTITLNRKKVIDKATAYGMLEQSKKFMAFYSVSFPVDTDEDICYTAFNYWLINCRKYYGLRSYLWVAEYQSNGTVHYHLLTNDFMRIRDVNRSMSETLDRLGLFTGEDTLYYNRKKNKWVKGKLTKDNYNGVDVERVQGDRKKIIAYITKYVTKEKSEHNRRPWACSREVSALFTARTVEPDDVHNVIDDMSDKGVQPTVYSNEYSDVLYINVPIESRESREKSYYILPENKYYRFIREVNQYVFDTLLRLRSIPSDFSHRFRECRPKRKKYTVEDYCRDEYARLMASMV